MAGNVGPYSQDVLTRIYNVQWGGGGVFIAISRDGNIYYLNLDGQDEPAWEDLGTLGLVEGTDPFLPYPSACSYGLVTGEDDNTEPAFVIVAGGGNTTSPGIILASSDGKNWSRVHTFFKGGDTSRGETVWAVVWDDLDEAAPGFYAAGHTSDISDHWMSQTDVLFSSPDGFAWGEGGSNETRIDSGEGIPFPPWPPDSAGLLDRHCNKRVLTVEGYGTPDGNYGYDKTEKQLLIKPNDPMSIDYLFGDALGSAGSGITVEFSGEGDAPEIPLDVGLTVVTCVATAGGRWVVAGGTADPAGGNQPPAGGGKSEAAVLWTDADGKPVWKRVDPPGTNMIIAMCGGLLSESG
jgi:hypothetical protein